MTQALARPPVRIVLTGGPGAGKTAILELARRDLCAHVEVLPEAAGIVFGGGFPRRPGERERRAAQRAIYHVQAELESIAFAHEGLVAALCDRGTIDGLAYWPGPADEFFGELGTSLDEELARYRAVIHVRVPTDPVLYQGTALRLESHREALAIDARLLEVWSRHPDHVVIDGAPDFLAKAKRALAAIHDRIEGHDCFTKV